MIKFFTMCEGKFHVIPCPKPDKSTSRSLCVEMLLVLYLITVLKNNNLDSMLK